MKYLYLIIDGLSLLGPLALSFDKRVAFYSWWKFLFPAIVTMMLLFIPWDIWFTDIGIWGFNSTYLTGINVFNLPVEEVLFFLVVPYACVFIYACYTYYVKWQVSEKVWRTTVLILAIVLVAVAVWKYDHLYTSITFGLTSVFLLLHFLRRTPWFGRFFIAYLISMLPFFLVNGVLTGSGIDNQVVWYNTDHILNVRIGTIPIEDSMYSLLMIGLTVNCLEIFRRKHRFNR